MKYLHLAIGLLAIVLVSCQTPEEKAWEETMGLHDQIMVKMQENAPLESKFLILIEKAEQDTNSILYSNIGLLNESVQAINESDAQMMKWIAEFQKPQDFDSEKDYFQYIEEQRAALKAVETSIMDANKKGNDVIAFMEKSPEDQAWETTMTVHDEIMLQMDVNGQVESRIFKLIDKIEKEQNPDLLPKLDSLKEAAQMLEDAGNAMMDWMKNVRNPKFYKGDQDYVTYILGEKDAIIAVGLRMEEARLNGEAVLKSMEE